MKFEDEFQFLGRIKHMAGFEALVPEAKTVI